MLGLDPTIDEHNIDIWADAIPIQQKQMPIHPSKHNSIEAKIDKLKQASFIYPIESTTWVSNHVPI